MTTKTKKVIAGIATGLVVTSAIVSLSSAWKSSDLYQKIQDFKEEQEAENGGDEA